MSAYHRRRARQRGVAEGHTGAVTSIQRAGSFANANVHFHTLVPEGVWYERTDGAVAFHALPPPTDEDVVALTERIVGRVARLLRTRDADGEATDPPELDGPQSSANASGARWAYLCVIAMDWWPSTRWSLNKSPPFIIQ